MWSCCQQHFSTLDSYTISSRDPAKGRGGHEDKRKGGGGRWATDTQRGKGVGEEEFGRQESIHGGYKEPMSTPVEGQKTELALERLVSSMTHRRVGQGTKTHSHVHKQLSSIIVYTLCAADSTSFYP